RDAEWAAQGVHVDAGAGVVRELALEQMRNARGELHDLQAALDVAERVGDGLAVLGGQQPGQRVLLASTRRGKRSETRGRRWGFHSPHSRWARTASAVAASVSARFARGTRAWTSPVLGSYTSPKTPDVPGVCFPPMKWVCSRTMEACSHQVRSWDRHG